MAEVTAPPQRPRGRPPLVEDRRVQIVECAFNEIAVKGLEGLRMRGLATVAGIDHSTIHHYFATKQDLLTAVVDHATRPLWGTTPREGSPTERIRTHLRRQAALIAERPELLIVLREFDLRATRDPAIAEIVNSREAGWRAALTRVFHAGRNAGVWPDRFAVADAVGLIIATVKGASLRPATARFALCGLEYLLLDQHGQQTRP